MSDAADKDPKIIEKLIEKFTKCYIPGPPGECWVYPGEPTDTGYRFVSALVYCKSYVDAAHRVSYRKFKGPIPATYHVDHACRVRSCINPAHLRAIPPDLNSKLGKAYQNVTECRDCDVLRLEVRRLESIIRQLKGEPARAKNAHLVEDEDEIYLPPRLNDVDSALADLEHLRMQDALHWADQFGWRRPNGLETQKFSAARAVREDRDERHFAPIYSMSPDGRKYE